jgi:hypothetical protein
MMRGFGRRWWLRAVLLASAGVVAQSDSATAQGVTPESLRGRSIEASVQYQVQGNKGGREFNAPLTVDWRLNIGGDGRVTGSVTRSSTGMRGPISTSRQISAVIGRPREIPGSGHGVMLLSGNTLTVLRTFEVGGNKTTITFSGGGCSIRSPVMQEVGAGTMRRDHITGGTAEIRSARQVASSCRVSR